VPAQWPGSQTSTAQPAATVADTTVPAAELAWQDYLTDDALQQVITFALAHNRDLRIALLNVELARAQLGLRRADQLPTVNASAGGSRAPNSAGGITSMYSAGLTVTAYELDFFDRVANLKDQALAQYLASEEGSRTARIGLIATVAQTWLTLLADEELLSLSRQALTSRDATLALVQLRFQHGAASALELSIARSLAESARVTLAQQQRQRALDENALTLLMGQPLPALLRRQLQPGHLTRQQLKNLPADLPSDLLQRRPDIRQAEQLLVASNAGIGAARAAFFPRISLTTGAGMVSNALTGLFSGGSWGFSFAPQLVLPLLDGGRNQAQLDAALTGQNVAIAQYDRTVQTAFREVADALASRDAWIRQLTAQQAQTDAEADRLRLTDLRLQNGAASLLEWLDAERSVFAARQSLVQTRLAGLQNQITLYKALGGGDLVVGR
jgi:multidrug efflux system outer membrane protein